MSAFDDFDADLSADMEAEFGDTVVLRPTTRSDYGVAPVDPDRPERSVLGIFSSGPIIGKLDGDSRGQAFHARRATEIASFWISAAALAAIPYEIRPDDHLIVPGYPKSFRVVAVLPTSQGDAELHLTQ